VDGRKWRGKFIDMNKKKRVSYPSIIIVKPRVGTVENYSGDMR
jgi:hypothetical protein